MHNDSPVVSGVSCHYARGGCALQALLRRRARGFVPAFGLPSKPHVASVPLAGGHAGPQLGKSGLFAGSLGQGVNFCESVP